MRTLAIGGNSRSVGKTSLATSVISATRDAGWTAVKLTLFGHGICSRSGAPCSCAIEDPACPYEIWAEDGSNPATDTGRLLAAGASEVLWVRVAMGQLGGAIPAIRKRLSGRRNVLFESNSIVGHWIPDAYLSVLRLDCSDCKASAARLASAADAFVIHPAPAADPQWPGFDAALLRTKPVFPVQPPGYCSREVVEFVRRQVLSPSQA